MIRVIFVLLALFILLFQFYFIEDKTIVLNPQLKLKNTIGFLETSLFYIPLLCIVNTFLQIGIIYVILISACTNPTTEVEALIFFASLVLYFMIFLSIDIIFSEYTFPYGGFVELFKYVARKLKIFFYSVQIQF
jgi:hypothetical protein